MKRITLFFLLFFTQVIFAQFSAADVKYFIGTGAKTAYLVVDFNDEHSPTSYVWGYRFDDSNLTMEDLINEIGIADPSLQVDVPSGFLYSISYNHHNPSTDDYWSTWSGISSNAMKPNNGVNNDPLVDGKWYGASYGFGFTQGTSYSHPSEPVAAYDSQWYNTNKIATWLGTGTNKSLVVVDFGTDTNSVADSYVFGIKYNGTLTAEEALDFLSTELSGFDYTLNVSDLNSVTIGPRTESASGVNMWQVYKGTDLSTWKKADDFSEVKLNNGEWLGLSIGARRPFTPHEITSSLSNEGHDLIDFSMYPNPVSSVLNIQTKEIVNQLVVYNLQGRRIKETSAAAVDVSSLASGVYLLELHTAKGKASLKFVKK